MNNKNTLLELCHAKRLDNGEWVEGNLIRSGDAEDGQEAIIIPAMNRNMFIGQEYAYLGFNYWYRVDPSSVCHCTGHKDKNDKLIWEHDIVRCVYGGKERIYTVVWDDSELDFKATNGKENYSNNFEYLTCCDEIEIIGNVFDTPEFIKHFEGEIYYG